ncbi:MAG: pyridoxine 5'-phosphate synthase [Paludibacteraceae bacterium]|nr:pyridoxine 5'-phosphate synthase [Paludibacteraceae bacterium]
MTTLSVNINKVATIRNARGGNIPNVVQVALDCEDFGADGITVHPRPDERHIRYQDVRDLKAVLTKEFNIEGYPNQKFVDLVCEVVPTQVTLVPDPPEALTSSAGWDTIRHFGFLREVVKTFQAKGIRTSIFTGTDPGIIRKAAETGTDRIELYTEPYASMYEDDREMAIADFVIATEIAKQEGLDVNAGHDLSLKNLAYFHQRIPGIAEVSIGHALISDALYLGLNQTIQQYKQQLNSKQ